MGKLHSVLGRHLNFQKSSHCRYDGVHDDTAMLSLHQAGNGARFGFSDKDAETHAQE
jgi:hypothetical protein